MSRFLLRWAINTIALWAAVEFVPGIHHEGSGFSLLLIALIFGLVNALIRPLLVLLTCPFIILTMGLFILIVNTIMLSLTAWLAGPEVLDLGLTIEGFWPTFLGALVISIISGVINAVVKDASEEEKRPPKRVES
ncbi:MAG: phage holin family protein [Chloroflexi bacterium]|nr:phage holin family protein [Chloroflexota bacterium]MCI0574796.1 phage holin family protein [Chloroflexota bacterium]MCI0649817.1 phage holin family protein [Chloroflexota bacterium]MCI0731060.1 phage holin family protein [Chloroflexota bacterium]